MSDARLDRSADGRCTLFVGHMLVFSDLTEVQARDLMRAFGAETPAQNTTKPVPASGVLDVGGRAGRILPRTTARRPEQALARLR